MIWQKPTFWHPSNKMRPQGCRFFLTIYAKKMMVLMLLLLTKWSAKLNITWTPEKRGIGKLRPVFYSKDMWIMLLKKFDSSLPPDKKSEILWIPYYQQLATRCFLLFQVRTRFVLHTGITCDNLWNINVLQTEKVRTGFGAVHHLNWCFKRLFRNTSGEAFFAFRVQSG